MIPIRLNRDQLQNIVGNYDPDAIKNLELLTQRVNRLGFVYGELKRGSNQTPTAADTPNAVEFDEPTLFEGVTIANDSEISFEAPGLYQVDIEYNIQNTAASTKIFYGWIRKNGEDVADSLAIEYLYNNNESTTMKRSILLDLEANDYIEIMFAANATTARLQYLAASSFAPAKSACTVNVRQIRQIE